jgi:hypothetical protein
MRDSSFFEQIQQVSHTVEGHEFKVPTFYYDITTINAAFLTPVRQVKKRLPSRQMKPVRVTPFHAITAITAFEYRDTDIGPYNEVSIGLPVTVGRAALVGWGALRVLQEPTAYVMQLPVTTEIARYGGVAFFGFPKFIAEIEFQRENGWIHCHLAAEGKDIFTLSARQLKTKPAGRSRLHALTIMGERILRSEIMINQPQRGVSIRQEDVRLELGDHAIANNLREMQLGRMLQLQHMPAHQSILTSAIESYPA